MSKVQFVHRKIFIDGKNTRIISGALHYFRIPRPYWMDRLQKAKACGLNCVETYLAWNLHEPEEGKFDFIGQNAFDEFIKIAGELGLYVIVRPGPYICAEWDNGGIPAWVMTKNEIGIRRSEPQWLALCQNYFDAVLPRIVPLQYDNGGPVIALQVENEYGAYGNDSNYLAELCRMNRQNGITVPLFCADWASSRQLESGLTDGTFQMLTGGSKCVQGFEFLKKYRADDPPFYMEFWCGWFDFWGNKKHVTRGDDDFAREIDEILTAGGNVNLYVFHGGTNFGFNAGANGWPGGPYEPDVTSYDYDAPLSETGDPTQKYFALQKVIHKHFPDGNYETPAPVLKADYGQVALTEYAQLFDCGDKTLNKLSNCTHAVSPMCMEEFGQQSGFIHYRTTIRGPQCRFGLWNVHDRAHVFVDGKLLTVYYRNDAAAESERTYDIGDGFHILDILVESFGHINFGINLCKDFKGIYGDFCIDRQIQLNWEIRPLPMNNLDSLAFQPIAKHDNINFTPAFFRGTWNISETPRDTFLKFPGTNGFVVINGYNVGRYWSIGPQKTLYVPAPFLRCGTNEIIVFETDTLNQTSVEFTDAPELS